jgi:hypothetical protein
MKLHFHGQTYDSPHTEWKIAEGEVGGYYRGSPWKIHRLKEQHRYRRQTNSLVYRGVHYTKDQS